MPGLHIYTSNRLERLSEQLSALLRAAPLPPLQQEIIIVQSRGMEHWLCLEIARRNGICANIAFPFPRSFVYNLFSEIADIPESSSFSPEVMTWKIMQALPGLMQYPEFESLRHYLAGENAELKLFQLSEKIAAVFDQYLIFRPEMITAWDRGKNPAAAYSPHAAWQMLLWRQITRDDGSAPLHHAALKNLFVEKMRQEAAFKNIPCRISVFGISTLPPCYLEVLSALARKIDVYFFYLNPCQEYWKYIYSEKEIAAFEKKGLTDQDQYYEKGNSLLASMGVSGREFFSLVDTMTEGTTEALFEEPGQGTLLACVQSDILHLIDRRHDQQPPPALAGDDRSLQIHCCHSPMREVEVLYDNLLSLFDRDRTLLPRDIVVMTPDIATYAPLVQAVFDTPENPAKQIPYSIADISSRMDSGVAGVLLSILMIDRQRFRSPAVLDILAHPAVREKFLLSDEDLQLLRQWTADTAICWGIDGPYRAELGLPGFHENTWRFGLERMLLGYGLTEREPPELFRGILPYTAIEGGAARVLGSFGRFVETLFACSRMLTRDRTPAAWADELSRLLDQFFAANEETEHDLKELRDLLTDSGLAGHAAAAGFDAPVSRDVICSYLGQRLGAELRHRGFISQGVTFCTMLPMRSIPFRVIYLLGMNDAEYPRRLQRPGFDLMESRRRLCDRSKRHEDRFIFLEALLSARAGFIISYVGRSIKDNSLIPPSVLVCELEDYITQAFGGAARQQIITEHPLQPFSAQYFLKDAKLFSYSEHNFAAARASRESRPNRRGFIPEALPPAPSENWRAVSLEQICGFFASPCEFLVRNRLVTGLRLAEIPEPEDREPFTLDGLQRYRLRQDILDVCLKGCDPETLFEYFKASGKLPPGSGAASQYQALAREAAAFAEEVGHFAQGPPVKPQEVLIEFDEPPVSISGRLCSLYAGWQVFYRCAGITAKDRLKAWIYHLALYSSGGSKTTVLLGRDEKVSYVPLSMLQARQVLQNLAALFTSGLTRPLPFFPQTSYAYAEAAIAKGKDEAAALRAAALTWYPGYATAGEGEDVYIQTCFGTEMPRGTAFQEIARTVYEPMFQHMEKLSA